MSELVNGFRQRQARNSLTRSLIVDAALKLVDEEGIAGFSMPALARRLGCGAMSLYGHVASKDDLLEAVAERAFATVPMPEPLPDDVQGILYAWGGGVRAVLEAHPHVSVILLRQAVVGPGILRGAEYLLRALAAGGIPPQRGVHALYAVLVYGLGSLAWELPRTREQPQSAYAAKWRQVFAGLEQDEFPVVGGVIEELGRVAGAEQFEFGLDALVRGLSASAGESSRPHGHEPGR